MHSASLFLCASLLVPSLAFYPYIPEGHPGAPRKIHVSDAISKGFAFDGAEKPLNHDSLLGKASLFKREHKRTTQRLAKRLNDFTVQLDNAPSQKQSAAIDQDGTDFSYFSEITVGSGTVYMLLDTGSSAMWVMGSTCQSAACASHQLSTSSNITDDSFSIGYSTGNVTGMLASDQMQFAGMTLDVTIGLATDTSSQFEKYPMDGILGLARTATGTDFGGYTFIELVKQANALPANVFGVWLSRANGAKDGEINFGAPDTSRFSGSLNYIDTDMSNLNVWQIPVGDVLVDGKASGLTGRNAILDTGTTYMFVAPSDADAIFANVQGATLPSGSDMYNLPCDTTTNISLVLGNVAYEIAPADYVGPSVGNGMCYTHIIGQSAAGDDNTWLLGDTFLRNVYSVFDADQNRIGLGLPVNDADVTSTSSGTASTTGSSSSGGAHSTDTASSNSGSSSSGSGGTTSGSSSSGGGGSSSGSNTGGSGGLSGGNGQPDEGDAMGTIGAGASLDSARAGTVAVAFAAVVAAAAVLL